MNGWFFATMLGAAVAVWSPEARLVASQSPATAEKDTVLGTWQLNVAKSTFSPGPAPKSQTRTYEPYRDDIKTTIRTVYADGRTSSVQFITDDSGDQVPVSGSSDTDMLSLKKVGANIAEIILFHAGQEIGSARRVISQNGKTMTITVQMTNQQGTRGNDVRVFEKE